MCLLLVFVLILLVPHTHIKNKNSVGSPCRWARRGDVWEAADLMQQMKREGVQPDIHTYTSFVNACCKAGDMQVCSSFITVYFPLHYR